MVKHNALALSKVLLGASALNFVSVTFYSTEEHIPIYCTLRAQCSALFFDECIRLMQSSYNQ